MLLVTIEIQIISAELVRLDDEGMPIYVATCGGGQAKS